MNSEGAIAQFETDEDAKVAGYDTQLTDEEASKLRGMNRRQRRAALAKMRREKRAERRRLARAAMEIRWSPLGELPHCESTVHRHRSAEACGKPADSRLTVRGEARFACRSCRRAITGSGVEIEKLEVLCRGSAR